MEVINYYQKELKRVAWRLQYKARSKRKRECALIEDVQPCHYPFENVEDTILVAQLLDEIQSNIGRKIIHDFYLKSQTEAQLASELHISQQAVNKWKRKTLRLLLQKVSS